ncbi:hypothetical protein ANRL3_01156 [Anaerolineae bacterium]|nr:hypothetical protein ANRL3_01156 [Anaerolineae bacterium]
MANAVDDFLQQIRERVANKWYQISVHAEEERENESITLAQIGETVQSGEILEDYPEDRRGHSCLILGFTTSGQAIHSVWTILTDGRARLITVYLPQPPKWIDPRSRGKKATNENKKE